MSREAGRVVAFDLGDRRIGVAVSDPSGTIAQGRPTLKRSGESTPWRAIVRLLEEAGAACVVVGDPLRLDGSVGERSREARAFAAELAQRTGLRVELQDERLTTVQAQRALRAGRPGRGRPSAKRRAQEDADRSAAVLILQAWLDRAPPGPAPAGDPLP